MPIGGVQIPARGLTGSEGEVRGKVQELTAVTGVAGVGEERSCGGVSTASRGERRCSEVFRGTAAAFLWPEGRRAARKWLDSFHVMMWC
jgi:hypothetical protein